MPSGVENGMKVIIADDEVKVANLIKALIDWEGLGMELAGMAKNGDEALNLIREHDPDIMITDIRMPGLGGIELIEKAKDINPALEFIIISGYRHFNYARSAMHYGVSDYLLKPVDRDELHRTLARVKEKIILNTAQLNEREQILRMEEDRRHGKRLELFDLLMDPANRGMITREYLNDNLGYHFEDGDFRYVIFKVDGNAEEVYSEALVALEGRLRELMEKHLASICFDFEITFIYAGGNIVLNYPEEKKEEVRSALRDIFDEARTQNHYLPTSQFTMLSGPPSTNAAGLMDSWHDAEWMVYERVMTGTGSFYEEMPERPGADGVAALARSVTKAIEQAMDVMDEDLIGKAIMDAVKTLSSMNDLTGKDVRNFVRAVYDAWLMFALQYNVTYPGGEMIREDFLRRLDLISSADGIYAFLRNEIRKAFLNLKETLGEASGRPITHAKQYIKEHFADPVVIDDIAAIAGFNPSYFSTLFKKVTGVTFSEYLRGVRMDEAKRLLKETNSSVAVICGDVGYNDIKHFSASFRKVTGVKPSEYRKLYSWGK